jgi:hypothetical protein
MPTAKKSLKSEIATTRREYEKLKRARRVIGKKAFGKPEHSPAKRDYHTVDREYKKVGKRLGRLTGLKPRKSRKS